MFQPRLVRNRRTLLTRVEYGSSGWVLCRVFTNWSLVIPMMTFWLSLKAVERSRSWPLWKTSNVPPSAIVLYIRFLEGISRIYNEVPVRQGKHFWHYGKDLQTIRHALATYLERSLFIGAYYQDELVGFMKITWVGTTATITQILSLKKHFDKRPNNLMIAKAIEICEKEGMSHFIYGNFVYFDPNSTLTEFKRRHGFEPVQLPRYYIPLTLKGSIAIGLGLHRGIAGNTPKAIMRQFLRIRKRLAERKLIDPSRIKADV